MAEHVCEWMCHCGEVIKILKFKAVPLTDEYALGVFHKGGYIAKAAVNMKMSDEIIAGTLVLNARKRIEHMQMYNDSFSDCAWVGF